MRFTNKFKATSLIALALVLGACSGFEFPSFSLIDSTSSSISSQITSTGSSTLSISTHTVIWKNHDETLLELDSNVPFGSTPSYDSIIPTKTSTYEYEYAFIGWFPTIVPVTEDITYIAQFSATILSYTPITTAQELSNIRNNPLGNYRLMNDIDLELVEWQPIGTANAPFSGILDGNDFSISNLTITETQEYVGLFANNSGRIKNLKLSNVTINVTGSISSLIYAGALVANNTGIIENIETINGSLFVKARGGNIGFVGGIIGFSRALHQNLTNSIDVTSENGSSTGGIVGKTERGASFENSINTGKVFVSSGFAGGLVGRNGQESNATFINSANKGNVSGIQSVMSIGGLIGFADGKLSVISSFNEGNISGLSSVGGLVGEVDEEDSTFTNSTNDGLIIGDSHIGGFLGNVDSRLNVTIESCINNGIVGSKTNSDQFIGGFIGSGGVSSNYEIKINSSINNGEVNGRSYVGGLIGYGTNLKLDNSINNGQVNGTSYVGGIIGSGSGNVTNSINTRNVLGKSNSIGGIIGLASSTTTITNSMNNGGVSGGSGVGGLVGLVESVGGQLFVYYSVNLGNVVASNTTTEIGGILGRIPNINDFEDAFHYGSIKSNGVEVAGTNFGTKVTDISTFNLTFFTTTLGWDTEIWDFSGLDIANGVYPTLKNMPVVEE
jgi:hypothetical protein